MTGLRSRTCFGTSGQQPAFPGVRLGMATAVDRRHRGRHRGSAAPASRSWMIGLGPLGTLVAALASPFGTVAALLVGSRGSRLLATGVRDGRRAAQHDRDHGGAVGVRRHGRRADPGRAAADRRLRARGLRSATAARCSSASTGATPTTTSCSPAPGGWCSTGRRGRRSAAAGRARSSGRRWPPSSPRMPACRPGRWSRSAAAATTTACSCCGPARPTCPLAGGAGRPGRRRPGRGVGDAAAACTARTARTAPSTPRPSCVGDGTPQADRLDVGRR